MAQFLQGGSAIATPLKQDGLQGIFYMQTIRWKDRHPLIFVDLYSGSGRNVIEGESINGSPLSMLNGIYKALASSKTIPKHPWLIVFSDIAPGRATSLLPENVMRWQEESGLPIASDKLTAYTKNGTEVSIPIRYIQASSANVVAEIQEILDGGTQGHFIMAVDPNGPKDAPWDGLQAIWDKHKHHVEMVFHISATMLKRVAKAKESTGFNFAPIPDHVTGMLEAFKKCGGWIRDPVGADQWTIALISKYPPKFGWNTKTASFHLIASDIGKETIKRLTYTKKELNNECNTTASAYHAA